MTTRRSPRLFLVLGDQLHPDPHPLISHVSESDFVLMVEVPEESTYVWSHKARTALFFSAMRHFAARQRAAGRRRSLILWDNIRRLSGSVCWSRVMCVLQMRFRIVRACSICT